VGTRERERADVAVFIMLKLWLVDDSGSILGVRSLPVFVTHLFHEAVIITDTTRLASGLNVTVTYDVFHVTCIN
jgi:hypothetical protein